MTMTKKAMLLIACAAVITGCDGSGIGFKALKGTSGPDAGEDIIQTTEGGYAIVGHANSNLWLLKLDAAGKKQWSFKDGIDASTESRGEAVVLTSDGNLAVLSNSIDELSRLRVFDLSGKVRWSKYLYDTVSPSPVGPLVCGDLVTTDDGCFLVAGSTSRFDTLNDVWLGKYDAGGNVLWQRTYGDAGTRELATALLQTRDGGFLVAGRRMNAAWDASDILVVKFDAAGTGEWERTFGGERWDAACAAGQLGDGRYVVAGRSNSFGPSFDGWIAVLDAQGFPVWSRNPGGTEDDELWDMKVTPNDEIVCTGWTRSSGAGAEDIWIIRYDAAGNELWSGTYGDEKQNYGNALAITREGGIVVTGSTSACALPGDCRDFDLLFLEKTPFP